MTGRSLSAARLKRRSSDGLRNRDTEGTAVGLSALGAGLSGDARRCARAPGTRRQRRGRAAGPQAWQTPRDRRGEGYRRGQRDGREPAGRGARAETAPRIARMDELLAALTTDLTRVDRELAKDVVQLALSVARNMVGASLKVR